MKEKDKNWIARGKGIYLKGDEWAPLLRDSACSEKNIELVAEALNAYPAFQAVINRLKELVNFPDYRCKIGIMDILEVLGED